MTGCDDDYDENTFEVPAEDPLSEVIDVEADAVFLVDEDDVIYRHGEDDCFLRAFEDDSFERPSEEDTFYRVA